MAKIVLMTLYDDYCIGMRLLAALLHRQGHDVSMVFFKQPSEQVIDAVPEISLSYQVLRRDSIIGVQYDVNPFTVQEEDLLLELIGEKSPDILGLSSRSFLDGKNSELLRRIREAYPGLFLMAGGFGPTLNPESYAAVCDVVVIGEGETAVAELARCVDARKDFRNLSNIAYQGPDGRLVRTPLAEPLADLDAMPFPGFGDLPVHYIDQGKRFDTERIFSNYTVYYMLAGRGCVGECAYCSAGQWRNIYAENGSRYPKRRNRSLDNIFQEIDAIKGRFKRIHFLDSYFTGSKSFLKEFFSRYRREVGLPFYAQFFTSQILDDPELLDMAVDAGFYSADFGIQSGSESICRDVYNRRVPARGILEMAKLYDARGIISNYQFIAGNPFESEADLLESMEFLAKLPIRLERDWLTVARLGVFPKSPLGRRIKEHGVAMPAASQWLWQASLYGLRTVSEDAEFLQLFHDAALRREPQKLFARYQQQYRKRLLPAPLVM